MVSKIYTRTGDKGETGLIGGERVSKDNDRIVAYGTVDELNSSIGIVISLLTQNKERFIDIIDILVKIQNDLFVVGSDLANPLSTQNTKSTTPRVTSQMGTLLEPHIDNLEEELEPLSSFILPGGSLESSFMHQSRSIARRAERSIVKLAKKTDVNPAIVIYLNRLSDLLFVMARVINRRFEIKDTVWRPQ